MKKNTFLNPNTNSGDFPENQRKYKQVKRLVYLVLTTVVLGCIGLLFWSPSLGDYPVESALDTEIPPAIPTNLQRDKIKAYQQSNALEHQNKQQQHREDILVQWQQNALETQADLLLEQPQKKENSQLNLEFQTKQKQAAPDRPSFENRLLQQLKEPLNVTPTPLVNQPEPLVESLNQIPYQPLNTTQAANHTFEVIKEHHSAVVTTLNEDLVEFTPQANVFISLVPNQPTLYQSSKFAAITTTRQTVTNNSLVALKLLEPLLILGKKIDKGATVMAKVKIENQRVHLQVESIDLQGQITAVRLVAYDLDAQKGLQTNLSLSAELTQEVAQNSNAAFHISSSTSGALFTDLTKELVGGVSKLINKKNRTPKVTLPLGYKLYLVNQ